MCCVSLARSFPSQVAFSTLAFLIAARVTKKSFKNKKGLSFLKFIPEIFVGVCITTCTYYSSLKDPGGGSQEEGGTKEKEKGKERETNPDAFLFSILSQS